MLVPFEWIGPTAAVGIFTVMFSLGLLLEREQFAAALERRIILAAIVFAVVVPVPALAVLAVKLFSLEGAVAAGIILVAISPGAPVALRRSLDAGGHRDVAPALHLSIVLLAVLTVPLTMRILDWIFAKDFDAPPMHIGRQIFFAQLLPLALGASLRAWKPALAARIERPLARLGNLFILAVAIMGVVDFPAIHATVGWAPAVAGGLMTVVALGVGAAFAGRDAEMRLAGAVAAAMRNPGIALVLATVNRMPAAVTAAIFAYALGMGVAMLAFVQWRRRRRAAGGEVR
jgi:BASS family bile acid:Na+ symporter